MSTREAAIDLILNVIPKDALVVTCNGKIGRELWELRKKRGESNDDFITVGAMGCAFPLAVALAMNTKKKVVCLLGDGNFLMKMGALATYMRYRPLNLTTYILNNGAHDSTGGQETNFNEIRRNLPYSLYFRMVDVEKGAREDLGRPNISPAEIARNFHEKVQSKPVKAFS